MCDKFLSASVFIVIHCISYIFTVEEEPTGELDLTGIEDDELDKVTAVCWYPLYNFVK